MRVEMRLMLGVAGFLALVAIVYGFWSREATGTACLLFGFAAYGLIGLYFMLQWHRRHKIERPEDRVDATHADGAGEVGFFPAASIWPAGIGLGGVFLALGMVFGTWYYLIGGILVFGAVIGFSVEAEAREEGPDEPGTGHPTDAVPPTTAETRLHDIEVFEEH